MSALNQQEEVAGSGKYDKNNVITGPALDSPGNGSREVVDSKTNINLNTKLPDHITQQSITTTISKILAPTSSKAVIDQTKMETIDATDKCAVGSKLNITPAVSVGETSISNENVAKYDPKTYIATCIGDPDENQPEISKLIETEYKETAIDDSSDCEFELKWPDDDEVEDLNSDPLTDDALKLLDKELGIEDKDNIESTSKKSQNDNSITIPMETDVSKDDETVSNKILVDETSNLEKEIKSDNEKADKIVKDLASQNDDIVKQLASENDILKEQACSTLPKPKVDQEETKPIESVTEPSVLKDTIQPMCADNLSVESKMEFQTDTVSEKSDLVPQTVTSEKMTEIEKDDNKCDMVDPKEDKISEIDIDKTIVDVKRLIDQNEDTVKHLGLGVEKSDYKSIEKDKSHKNSVKEDTKAAALNSISNNLTVKDNNVQPMKENLPSEVENTASVTENKTTLGEKSIAKATKFLDQNIEASNILKCVSKVMTDSIASKDIAASNESDKSYTETLSNTKDTFQTPKDKIDIQSNISVKANKNIESTTELKEINTTECNITEDTPKNVSPKDNYKIAGPCLTTPLEVVSKSDNIISKETTIPNNDDENFLVATGDNSNANVEELINRDITNDSITINTVHRINRPDVMLDIPTQEFSFDDFDNTSEKQVSDKIDKVDSEMTAKTVTEIVNQLAKADEESMEVDNVIGANAEKSDTATNHKISEYIEINITQEQKQSEISRPEDTALISVKNNNKTTDKKVVETKNSDLSENMSPSAGSKQDNAVSKPAETSKEKSIDETPQEGNKLIKGLKTTTECRGTSENVSSGDDDNKKLESTLIENVKHSENILQKEDKIMKVEEATTKNIETSEKLSPKDDKTTELKPTTTAKVPEKESKITDVEPITTDTEPKSTENDIPDAQPSTSAEASKSSDSPEEIQEVADSLGLLAESSRVLDEDDEEEEEQELEEEADDGDGDDDEDFDPDYEENSNQTEEHSEESNHPNSEIDIQEDGIDIEFNDEADKIGIDSNDATFETLLGDSTDVTLGDNLAEISSTDNVDATKVIQKKTESKDFDSTEEGIGVVDIPTSERGSSLLADLLTKPAADMNLKSIIKKTIDKSMKRPPLLDPSIVDLEGSSSEEDAKVKKNIQQETPSIIQKGAKLSDSSEAKSTEEKDSEETKKEITDKSKIGEIFNLDSDDEIDKRDVSLIEKPRDSNPCINYNCMSDDTVPYYLADRMTIAYYGAARRRRRPVCQNCLDVVNARNEGLVSGIKDLRPLMSLRMARPAHTLLEISDSDSEGEDEPVGEEGARLLENQLADMLNDVWSKYNMDVRLKETEDYLEAELEKMQRQSEEVDKLLRECQKATDKQRTEFYSSFEGPRKEMPAISIHDTPIASYACLETEEEVDDSVILPLRYPKRRSSSAVEVAAKKPALSWTGDDKRTTRSSHEEQRPDEDKDISVVRLSAEVAPADLPPPGEPTKPPLRVGALVYAMKNQYGAWLKGKVLDIQAKTVEQQYTICKVRFEHKMKTSHKMLSARSIAYTEPCEVRMTIGTRVIALFKNSENTNNKRGEFYYSGVIAEIPNPVNAYRYLVFFDDGYAQYVEHRHTRLVYESKTLVWEEVHPFSRDFVCNYLMKYPERPMVRMHPGQGVTVEWNGKWWETKVITVDAALVHVRFPDNRTEWIYRGSTRLQPLFTELQAARRGDRARLPRSTKANIKTNVPYVEYTRSDDQVKQDNSNEWNVSSLRSWELRRQRTVAKKSTSIAQQITNAATDGVVSRVVFYTPKNSVRPLKMVPHSCGPHCKRSDLLTLNDLRTYNPLTKPLLSGWERQIVRHKASRGVMYRAPCGRRLRCVRELHNYLRAIRSDMPVDLFDFNPNTHCLAEFVLNKTNVQKKDLSHGKENVPVPCVNYYDHSLPEFCSYNTVRTPTAGVPLNLDPEFLCGCDCEDDCLDKTKCACWKMTLEGARTIGIEGPNIGYDYRRLPEPLPSGIYECNSRCKCKSTCLNRVVQNPLQLKLQVFKTLNRGWGIRALNDVPKGAFICIYAGNLLTDATANLDGLNEGDEYLAELDYIEVVESMKEGYEDDIPEADKVLDKKELKTRESGSESESTESEEEENIDKNDSEDGDFQPGYVGFRLTEFNKRLRRRDKKNKEETEDKDVKAQTSDEKSNKKDDTEECITISDDEEVRVSQREPSRFAAQEIMTDNKVVPKYRSIRTYFGKDEACYIMDAKVQGNIGRYLNHSCSPNVFVQNVFVDTHDPRFPWVSFFALHHIRAGTELTWNYNYDIGSVPGKVLYCYCGAPNCRGRLL